MTTKPSAPKISVKIWRPIIDKLDAKIKTACLRRDAFLIKVLEFELHWLDEEVSIPNSKESYDYVSKRLDKLDRNLVSLALPLDITDRLKEICSRKRIVRDAFFNRLFLLLAVSPKFIDTLLFDGVANNWRGAVWNESKHDGSFFQSGFYPLGQDINPFWAIRDGMRIYAEEAGLEDYVEPTSGKTIRVQRDPINDAVMPADSLYTTIFDRTAQDLLGLSCYVPDSRIPGNDSERERQSKLDELLEGLERLS